MGRTVALAGIGCIGLRPEGPDDDEFLLRLYASTRAEEMGLTNWTADQQGAFLRSQFGLQRTHYRRHYADAAFDVILLDGSPVGRMYVRRQPHEVCLIEISLLPEFRGRGIGGWLLRHVLEEARRAGASVTLHVEPFNRALRLYRRLGFTAVEQHGIYLFMQYRPGDLGGGKSPAPHLI